MKFTQSQQDAFDKFKQFISDPTKREMTIEGHAGTGKSFLTKSLIETVLQAQKIAQTVTKKQYKIKNIALTATTNKATEVLRKVAYNLKEHITISTVHALLDLKIYNDYKTGEQKLRLPTQRVNLSNTLIIVDEASMVNKQLMSIINKAVDDTCKIVYILDAYQLAPVGETECPVSTHIKTKSILTEIKRQTLGNKDPIVALAEQYRNVLDGAPFPTISDNISNIKRVNGDEFKALVYSTFNLNTPGHIPDSNDDAQILAWTNSCIDSYNNYIREYYTNEKRLIEGESIILNKPHIGNSGKIILPNECRVTVTESINQSYHFYCDVPYWAITVKPAFNVHGDPNTWFTLRQIQDNRIHSKKLREARSWGNKYNNWQTYFNLKDTFMSFRLPYASTIHKAQGSTYDTVFINLTDIGRNHNPTEVARLMYVALTRAKSQIYLYGNLGARYND